MKRTWTLLTALCLFAACAWFVSPAYAQNEQPIALAVELDPELELSGDGTITYVKFILSNASDAPYLLHNASLSCEKLAVLEALDAVIEVPSRGTKEIMLQNVPIRDSLLDTALVFLLSWQEVTYAPEDLAEAAPLYSDRSISAEVTIPRFVEPVISVSASADTALAKPGATVTATYTLTNNTKFDMTSLSLYDIGTQNMLIPLENSSLLAGETVKVEHAFEMGDAPAQLLPKVLYNVRGKLVETAAETPVVVDCAIISLDFAVQHFPGTKEGKLFSITVTNTGSHAMTDITIRDEIQTEVAKPFTLAPGQVKTLSYLVTTAVSATQPRMVAFTMTAADCFYDTYTYTDPNVYEVLPYISSEQVNISLAATLINTYTNENDVLCGTVSFELRNYSAVTLTGATLRETLVYTAAPLAVYTELAQGITTYSQDFAVADLSALSFVLTATDPSGTECRSDQVTIDLSRLTADPAAELEESLVSPDVIGSGIDMNKYFKMAFKVLLIIAVCVGVCCVVIYGLYSAERRERALLPLEDSGLTAESFELAEPGADEPDAFRTGRMEPLTASEQAAQYGYVAPTKLRYIEQTQTARNGFSDIPAVNVAAAAPSDVKVYRRPDPRDENPTIVVRVRARDAETMEGTKRFEAAGKPARTEGKAKKKAAPVAGKAAPVVENAAGYPRGIPTPTQANRRTQRDPNAVFRMQG